MKKRNEPTLLVKAIENVPGFEIVYKKLAQQVTLRGQSQSTLDNYIKCISRISLHFSRLPDQISDDEINEYLCALALDPKAPSTCRLWIALLFPVNWTKQKGYRPAFA